MKDVKVLIDRLCAVNMSIGVLCAIRSMLANLKACQNTLDAIYHAEEILAEKELELHEQLMEVLGLAGIPNAQAESTGAEGEVEKDSS
jgi:hypothetical protein